MLSVVRISKVGRNSTFIPLNILTAVPKSAECAHGEESLSRQLVRLRADEDAGVQSQTAKLLQQDIGARDFIF